MAAQNASQGFVPSTTLMNASPNLLFMYFLFHRWDVYLDAMMEPTKIDIDTATASLLSTCTDKDMREKFWKEYIDKKKELDSATTASILVSGEFFAYVAEACEFVEKSYGGVA